MKEFVVYWLSSRGLVQVLIEALNPQDAQRTLDVTREAWQKRLGGVRIPTMDEMAVQTRERWAQDELLEECA